MLFHVIFEVSDKDTNTITFLTSKLLDSKFDKIFIYI